MWQQVQKYAAFAVMIVLVVAAAFGYAKYLGYERELARLRNDAASRDQTIEELNGRYTKLATENGDLKASDADLRKLLKKTSQDLIAETQLTAYWKGKYTWAIDHQPIPDPSVVPTFAPQTQLACTAEPKVYRGVQDIGILKLTIDTSTVDPSYQQRLTVEQGSRPLQLTLDLTRDKDKKWHTHVQSSDERIMVNIGLNSVNIEPLSEKWYERLKLHMDVGVGSKGILAGAGLAIPFGQFEVGPNVWATTVDNGATFGGVNFSWAPFKAK